MNLRKEKRIKRGCSNIPFKPVSSTTFTPTAGAWLKLENSKKKEDAKKAFDSNFQFEGGSIPRKTQILDKKDDFFMSYQNGTSRKIFDHKRDFQLRSSKMDNFEDSFENETPKISSRKPIIHKKNMVSSTKIYQTSKLLKDMFRNKKSIASVFQSLDSQGKNYIDSESIRNFLREQGTIITQNEAKGVQSLADSTGTGNLGLKDFIKFLSDKDSLQQDFSLNIIDSKNIMDSKNMVNNSGEQINQPYDSSKMTNLDKNFESDIDINNFTNQNFVTIRKELEKNAVDNTMKFFQGKKQQFARMLDEKKVIKERHFEQIAIKQGLRQIIDKDFNMIKEKYFNEYGELKKEDFFIKLFDEDIKKSNNPKKIVSGNFYERQLELDQIDEKQDEALKNFKASMISSDNMMTGAHMERSMGSTNKVLGLISNRKNVLEAFQNYQKAEKLEENNILSRKQVRGFLEGFSKDTKFVKPSDYDNILSIMRFKDNQIHKDDVFGFLKDEKNIDQLVLRKSSKVRLKPFLKDMACNDDKNIQQNYSNVSLVESIAEKFENKAYNVQKMPTEGSQSNLVDSKQKENICKRSEPDFIRSLKTGLNTNAKSQNIFSVDQLFKNSQSYKKMPYDTPLLEGSNQTELYISQFEDRNFDPKKEIVNREFHNMSSSGNYGPRGNYTSLVANPYSPKQIEIDSNSLPPGSGRIQINSNCSVFPNNKTANRYSSEVPLDDCKNYTLNLDAPNFEKLSKKNQRKSQPDQKDKNDKKSCKINKSQKFTTLSDLYVDRSNKNRLKYIMKKIDDHLFPSNENHKTLFDKFDLNKDGFICEDDFVKRMTSMVLQGVEDAKILFRELDICEKGCLDYGQFHEIIKPGCFYTESRQLENSMPNLNRSLVNDSVFPSVKEYKGKKESIYGIKEYRKLVKENFEKPYPFKNTRFGFVPPSYPENTFLNFESPKNAAMYMGKAQRYDTSINRYVNSQKDEVCKSKEILDYKRANHIKTTKWIEDKKQYDHTRSENKGKSKISMALPDFVQI